MTTYNSERFLIEQLESINNQSLQADEVIISDDMSNDGTIEILERFIARRKLQDTWSIIKNPIRKGVASNFLDAAMHAKKEIIFFSDSDDIWHPKKIEFMMNAFETHPDMQACSCIDCLIDEEGKYIPSFYKRFSQMSGREGELHKSTFCETIKYSQSAGHNIALRKKLLKELKDISFFYKLPYDLPIAPIAAIHGGYYILNRNLVKWRQHRNGASCTHFSISSRLKDPWIQIKSRNGKLKLMKAILENYEREISYEERDMLSNAIRITGTSIQYMEEKKIWKVFLGIFENNPMINRWVAVNNFANCMTNYALSVFR